MRTALFLSVTGFLLIILSACVQPVSIARDRALSPLPYRIELTYTSALEDPHVIHEAPFSGIRAVPINRWAEEALRGYLGARSATGSAPVLYLSVRLDSLAARYREFGLVPRPTLRGSFLLLGGDDRDHEVDVPAEIRKGVTLTATVTLRSDESLIHSGSKAVAVDEVITWETFDDRSYDFDGLVREALRRLLLEIDDLLAST